MTRRRAPDVAASQSFERSLTEWQDPPGAVQPDLGLDLLETAVGTGEIYPCYAKPWTFHSQADWAAVDCS